MRLSVLLIFLSLIINSNLTAQDFNRNEIVVIKGNKFVLHQVVTGETIYSISKKYKIDQSVLYENNPKINDGLDIGEILKIPYNSDIEINQVPVYKKGDPTNFITHKIKSRKETPYFIAKKYGITVEEIYAYNPEKRRFKKGNEIRIPVWEIKTVEEVEKPETDIQISAPENDEQIIGKRIC